MQIESKTAAPSAESLRRKHEAQNPPAGWVVFVVGLVLLMLAASLFAGWLVLADWTKSRPLDRDVLARGTIQAPSLELLHRFPQPNLQINPHEDLITFRAHEEAELTNYGWLDRNAGVVCIPIKRAMDLITERGLPARRDNEPCRTGKSEFELARERPSQP